MARTVIVLSAPPDRVFNLLGDPRSLAYFVVGTKKIRSFDPHWPDSGTKVHHSVGLGPLVLRDETEVLESVSGRLLVLEVRLRPLGLFKVEFRLSPHSEGTELTVDEFPVAGPASLPGLSEVVDRLIKLRNIEMGRRIEKLVGQREHQWSMAQVGD
jgi:uncharacterized protein YndB with AHSA1/START domain